ncbi:hypothetical protein MACH26_38530 [Planctobacterium marinum]|uniref:Uncharacterized protein n=2 Tax=Planctobacterium marinum TaxID=1631968 RepID=A0AA48HRL3_9ALTE|nr:hypothetical protein MACH26_38530 [Planctobacterium marinum]
MKKIGFFVSCTLIILIAISWQTKQETRQEIDSPPQFERLDNSEVVIPEHLLDVEEKNSLSALLRAKEQCDERHLTYSDKVKSINNSLIRALQTELQAGKTETELMAYEKQYTTFHRGFDDLLLLARINLEKQKYQFTRSAEILGEWTGLSVINGLNDEKVPQLIADLQSNPPSGMKMFLSLKDQVSRSEIALLLDNKENFNTYLESPLGIEDVSVISPSVLVILTATRLDVQEFQQAIAQHNFTVNDVAVAIHSELPVEYISAVLQQTQSPEAIPVLMRGPFNEAFFNLADMAAAKHNTRLLQLLATYGVTPSDKPGIVTGLDIAIVNMKFYSATQSYPDEYFETLVYLKGKGYRAHGETVQFDGASGIRFSPPHNKSQWSSTVSDPELKKLLESIELISVGERIPQLKPDNSALSNAIAVAKDKRQELKREGEQCAATERLLRDREGFADFEEAREIIKRIEADYGEVAGQLHQIDPALYVIWYEQKNHRVGRSESVFLNLLRDKQFQQALEYSTAHPLTTVETDALLRAMLSNFDELLSVWQARVMPAAPSSLEALKYLKLEQWQYWYEQGFDFNLHDQQGRDVFVAAALSQGAVNVISFFHEKGLKPQTQELGPDVIDVLLELSYRDGKLHPALATVLPLVNEFEPNHYARVSRLKQFYPGEYTALVTMKPALEVKGDVPMNRFRLRL